MQRYISLKGSRIPQKLLKITEKEQSRSAVGAVRSEAGARSGAALRRVSWSAEWSGAPNFWLERGAERAPIFAGALMLCQK